MKKITALFVVCISISSCVSFDRAENTTNNYQINITFEQACILKNHYKDQNEDIPLSVQAVIEESDETCE